MRRPNWKLKWGRRAFSLLMVAVVLMSTAFALGNAGYSFSATKVIEWSEYLSPQSPLHEGDHFTDPKIQGADDATQQRGVEEYSALPPLPDDFISTTQGYLTLSYARESEAKADLLFKEALKTKIALEELFGRSILAKVEVRLARSSQEMFTLVPVNSSPPGYASGLAYSERGLILLTERPRYPNAYYQVEEVFRHELAHIALHDAIGRASVPRWFNEGVAVVSSGEAQLSRVQSLFTASVSGNLFPLRDIAERFPANDTHAAQAYAQSADFIHFLLKSGEKHRFASLLERLVKGQAFESALADAYASPLEVLEADWHAQLEQRFSIWPVLLGGSFVWAFALMLFFLAYFKRRRRTKLKLAQWAAQEARDAIRLLALRQQMQSARGQERQSPPEFSETRSGGPENSNPAELAARKRGVKIQPIVAEVNAQGRDSTPVMYVDPKGDHHTLH